MFKVNYEEGIIRKEALHDCGNIIMCKLAQMVDEDGKFLDAKLQAEFEAWQQSAEGARYA